MRDFIVYFLIVLLYVVESRTFCDDVKCECSNKENNEVTCFSHPTVLEKNYTIPDNVTRLDLSQNNLTRIKQPLVSGTLTELFLLRNQLTEIAREALNLPSLKILDISYNDLEFLHRDTFAQIPNLEYLNLANNKFNSFGNINFFHLKLLKQIVLDENNIGPSLEKHNLFDGGFELTDKIQSVSLSNVNLTSIKQLFLFDSTRSLKKLILDQNNITQILDLPLNLEYLDLSNNPIRNISRDDFFDLVYLNKIKLNNILIEEVPDFALHYLSSLRELELQNNKNLRTFSYLAWNEIILRDQIDLLVERLSLRGSYLTTLDGKLEGIFKKIQRVDLRDNPWNCDCKLTWLQNLGIPDSFNDFRCATPKNLFNTRVLTLNASEFVCGKEKKHHLKTNAPMILYCILLATAVLVMYLFVFSPNPLLYKKLPMEFPRTP